MSKAAIEAVDKLVREAAVAQAGRSEAVVASLREMSRFVERNRARLARVYAATVQRALLGPKDPLSVEWDLFEALGSPGEIAYTQFLASLLSGKCGRAARELSRTALHRMIAEALGTNDDPKSRAWKAAIADDGTLVHAELGDSVDYRVPGGELQENQRVRPDITISGDHLHALLELKLSGTWNGTDAGPVQPYAYAALGKKRCPKSAVLSLVSLANQRLPEAAGFLNLEWRDYTRALRRELRERAASPLDQLALIPVVVFLIALERQQMELRLPTWNIEKVPDSVSMNDLSHLRALAQYLETIDG